jgi:muramoyltetrapeptide carboxypeptidase LdcA involved in peptidoglycan recycling
MEPAGGWTWHNANRAVEGTGWGGDLEIVSWLLMADLAVRPVDVYSGGVLFLETGDSMPSAEETYVITRSMGERGLLERFSALLMGRPKTWSRYRTLDAGQKAQFRRAQREAVSRALAEYAPQAVAVFDVDLGHTDPQVVIPCGGRIRVDGLERRVFVTY